MCSRRERGQPGGKATQPGATLAALNKRLIKLFRQGQTVSAEPLALFRGQRCLQRAFQNRCVFEGRFPATAAVVQVSAAPGAFARRINFRSVFRSHQPNQRPFAQHFAAGHTRSLWHAPGAGTAPGRSHLTSPNRPSRYCGSTCVSWSKHKRPVLRRTSLRG